MKPALVASIAGSAHQVFAAGRILTDDGFMTGRALP
jgi:hypothetical protein